MCYGKTCGLDLRRWTDSYLNRCGFRVIFDIPFMFSTRGRALKNNALRTNSQQPSGDTAMRRKGERAKRRMAREALVPKGRKDSAWGFNPRNVGKRNRPESISDPADAGCNSEKAYSYNSSTNTYQQTLSRTRRTTRTRTMCLTRAAEVQGMPAVHE